MDERLKDIREGAGLEESRLNQDFLNWLNKWGNRILWVALIALALYVGNQWLDRMRRAQVDDAFAAFEEVMLVDPSPEALLAVAAEHGDTRAIGPMARLAAADRYLGAVRRGLVLGATIAPDGSVLSSEDVLGEDRRAEYLEQASAQYTTVYEEASGKPAMAIHAIGAAYGLAAVAESRGELDGAGEWYTRVESIAQERGYDDIAAHAAERRERIGELAETPRLYARDELPTPPAPADISQQDLDELMRQLQESGELGAPGTPLLGEEPGGGEQGGEEQGGGTEQDSGTEQGDGQSDGEQSGGDGQSGGGG